MDWDLLAQLQGLLLNIVIVWVVLYWIVPLVLALFENARQDLQCSAVLTGKALRYWKSLRVLLMGLTVLSGGLSLARQYAQRHWPAALESPRIEVVKEIKHAN